MQKGTVVYLAGGDRLPEAIDLEAWVAATPTLDPVWTELAGPSLGYPTVVEALRKLVQKGARLVDGVSAWFEPGHGLKLGPRCRLWG